MLLHANTYLWEYPLDLLPLVLLAIVPARAHPRVGSPLAARFHGRWPFWSVIRTQSDAVTQGFVGSPTFLIDGVDPFTHNGQPPAVACRVYPTVAGLRGTPPRNDLLAAVLKASSRERNRPGS